MLTDEHRQYLRDAAITDEVIDACGAESTERGISFLYRGPKKESRQLRPDTPIVTDDGRTIKYLFPKGEKNFVNYLSDSGTGPLMIVEGTKQALAAESWAPDGYAVIGLAGCTLWHKHDWDQVKGRDVLICFDGDAATNRDVYVQAKKFGDELREFEGASSVAYIQIPDGKGLDDYLADEDEEDRARSLVKLVRRAAAKPADSMPRPKQAKAAESTGPEVPNTGGRELIAVNGDLKEVVDNIIGALKARWDGHYLFNYGRALTCLEGPSTLPLEEGAFLRLLADTVYMVNHQPATQRAPERYVPGGRIDSHTKEAVLSAATEFTELNRVVRAPFVRPDGTVCTTPGYDAATKTILIDDPILKRISVPQTPTDEELRSAVAFLMDEWLGDMPFPTDGDRANALALLVTPFVRGMFPLAPMAVVNGLQMGVGKNLFADCVAVLATGKPAVPMPYTRGNDEETKKIITSAFRTGSELFVFDEAHVIEGPSLARALTSITYTDRILGASVVAEFPNQVTWMALGNQVQVNGDVARRVFWIELRPTGANPQDREASTFRHPDIRTWMDEHRPELVSAVLTIVRSWFAAGKPVSSRGTSLGSFEGWDRIVGGIVAHAGLTGFLSEIQTKRSESDFESAYWTSHIDWLWRTFGPEKFTTAQVREAAMSDLKGYEAPPRMEDVADKGYTRELGKRYAQKQSRWYDGKRLVKSGMGHKTTIKWRVEKLGEGGMDGTEGSGLLTSCETKTHTISDHDECVRVSRVGRSGQQPSDPSVPSTQPEAGSVMYTDTHEREDRRVSATDGRVHVGSIQGPLSGQPDSGIGDDRPCGRPASGEGGRGVRVSADPEVRSGSEVSALAFDLETCSADELHTRSDFVRLCGASSADGPHVFYDVGHLINWLDRADAITGHNILGFDLLALARHHGADYEALAAKAVDTMLIAKQLDPPSSKGMPAGYYSLDSLCERYGVVRKTDDIKRLAKKHGGFDQIPLDDPEYAEYLRGDVSASEALVEAMGAPDAYVQREHRVQAVMGRISLSGFRVDEELCWDRHQRGADKLDEIKDRLHREHDFPVKGAAPHRTNAGKEAFYNALRAAGLGPQWIEKEWPKNKDGSLSLAKEVLTEKIDVLSGPRPAAAEICEAILGMNGVRTVYGNVIDWTAGGRVHPQIAPDQASGRWSVTKPGLTVMGKRGGKHVEREIFLPEPGEVIVAFDLDQVDMRAIAGHCQDAGYMELFAPGRDVHSEIAKMVGLSREEAKAIGHGWNYGLGVAGQVRGGVREEAAVQFDQRMRESFPRLVEWKDEVRAIAGAGELLDNGFGRKLRVHPDWAYTQAPAQMGQGTTRDILAEGLLRLPSEILPMLRVVVHDEIVLSIPKDSLEDVSRRVQEALTFEFKGVPITCGASKAGDSWGACYSK